MRDGFIVISRKLLDWQYYGCINGLGIWMHLLLDANWADGWFQGKPVSRGSFITSYDSLAEECGVHTSTVRRWLKKFENVGQIEIKTTNKYTQITIVNYDKYQNIETGVNNQENNQENNQVNNQENKQVNNNITIKQENKNNNTNTLVENSTAVSRSAWFDEWWSAYPKKVGRKPSEEKFKVKCRNEETFRLMMTALGKQKQSDGWRRGYIPNPTTWLNQERWNDDSSAYQDHPAQSKGRQRRPDFTADFKEPEKHETYEEIVARRLRE